MTNIYQDYPLLLIKTISFDRQPLDDNEFTFIEGRKEYERRYELERLIHIFNLSEIILKVINQAQILN